MMLPRAPTGKTPDVTGIELPACHSEMEIFSITQDIEYQVFPGIKTEKQLSATNEAITRAVFLDRDGVINALVYHEEQGIIDSPFSPQQFKLIPGVPEAIELLRQNGYLTVLVSNQPSIGKGNMSLESFEAVRDKMRNMLSNAGTQLDAEYYCLHHPEAVIEKYRAVCDCRKPKPGLLVQAAQDMNIDLNKSWMVGDNLSDVKAGKAAGCRTILIGKLKCELCHLMDAENARPEVISASLREAVSVILGTGHEQSHLADEPIHTGV